MTDMPGLTINYKPKELQSERRVQDYKRKTNFYQNPMNIVNSNFIVVILSFIV